jgi:hypothetical protein
MTATSDAPRHLIHPGFAKAGSTFLQEWFSRHPQLRFVPHHLGGFRDVFDLAEAAREPARGQWRYYVTSNELLGSGGTVPYGCPLFSFRMLADADLRAGQRSVCAMLHEAFPEARVLIVTRGFAGIIRSLYSQYVKLGGAERFEDFLDRYASMLEQWLDVDHVVETYRAAFGEQVLVLPYERLREDPAGFCGSIEEFLELEPAPDAIPGARNASLGPAELYWYSRLSRGIVGPVLDRLPPERAARLYLGYAFKVLSSPRLADGARWLTENLGGETSLELPDGYLDRFRGRANCLADSPVHQPYLAEYLVEEGAGR